MGGRVGAGEPVAGHGCRGAGLLSQDGLGGTRCGDAGFLQGRIPPPWQESSPVPTAVSP